MEQLRVMTAAFSADDKKLVASLLQDDAIRLVCALHPDGGGLKKGGAQPADALVLCASGLPEAEFDFAERMYVSRGDLTIFLLVTKITPEIIASAMESGIARVLAIPEGAKAIKTEVIATTNRDLHRKNAQPKVATYASKIYQFFSPKGGAGKTTLAVNVACALAVLGKKVALMDFNLQFGDVGIFLDIGKGDTIVDMVEENRFELKTMKSYLIRHYSGVNVLLASSSPEYAELVKAEHIETILSTLRSEFDYIILDMPTTFTDCTIAALEISDTVYYVVTEDISTLNNAKRGLKVIDALNLSDKVRLAINKDGFSSIKAREVETLLDLKAAVVVPNDQEIAVRAINRGIPFVLSDKKSKIAKAVTAFAEKLVKEA